MYLILFFNNVNFKKMKNKKSKSLFEKLFTTKPKSSCCNIKIEEVVAEIENKSANSKQVKKAEPSLESSTNTK